MLRHLLLVLAVALAPVAACDSDAPPPPDTTPRRPLPIEDGVIRAAGSGALTPLVHLLGAAFAAQHPSSPRVVLEASVGSGGGVRAAVDGVVDLGLISRPLSAAESAQGMVDIPISLDTVIVAAYPDVPVSDLSSDLLRELCAGTRRTFADGSPATMLMRDRGESANAAMDAAVPGLAAARDAAYRQPWRRVYYHDDALVAGIVVTPGGMGFTSLALLQASHLPLKILRLDGQLPTIEATSEGRWKAVRTLSFVVRPDRLPHVQAFVDFARSDAARRILVANGYALAAFPNTSAPQREPRP